MTTLAFRLAARSAILCILLSSAAGYHFCAEADQVEMVTGDRYVGRVVSLGPDELVMQTEVLGTLKLPRSKISTISFSEKPVERSTNSIRTIPTLSRSNYLSKSSADRTNASSERSALVRQLNDHSNLVQQVQQQLLGGAGPEAQAKFNELMGSLLSGKLDLTGLRAEASSTLAQAKAARKELGQENGGMLDSYLAILDNFLKDTEAEASRTNTLVAPSTPAPPKARGQP